MSNATNKLWLLKPKDRKSFPWDDACDKNFGFVIRAGNETEAREIAQSDPYWGHETSDRECLYPWLDRQLTTCEELRPRGETGMILRDHRSCSPAYVNND